MPLYHKMRRREDRVDLKLVLDVVRAAELRHRCESKVVPEREGGFMHQRQRKRAGIMLDVCTATSPEALVWRSISESKGEKRLRTEDMGTPAHGAPFTAAWSIPRGVSLDHETRDLFIVLAFLACESGRQLPI